MKTVKCSECGGVMSMRTSRHTENVGGVSVHDTSAQALTCGRAQAASCASLTRPTARRARATRRRWQSAERGNANASNSATPAESCGAPPATRGLLVAPLPMRYLATTLLRQARAITAQIAETHMILGHVCPSFRES